MGRSVLDRHGHPWLRDPARERQRARLRAAATLVLAVSLVAAAWWLVRREARVGAPEASAGVVAVLRVGDGDTLTVERDGVRERVRLLGVDAPEVAAFGKAADCGADEATAALARLVTGGTVTLVGDPAADPRDGYGRLLAYVEVAGSDVGAELVRQGYAGAWYPAAEPRPARSDAYERLEDAARAARTGAWAHCERVGR